MTFTGNATRETERARRTALAPEAPPPLDEARAVRTHAPIIQANNVSLLFGDDAGVHNLCFEVPPGIILGLIGPSGAGKTTTVRLLAGLYKPMQGELRVLGETPHRFSTRTREQIGYMPQNFVLYPQLTVSENLNFVASLYGLPYLKRRKVLREVLELVELTTARERLGSELSGGMQRRLALAAALVPQPTLIFCDEPTAGIDPVLRRKFWEYFRTLREQGRTLFITTQYVGEAAHCDYVAILREGRMLYLDTPENLRRRALGGEVIRLVVDTAHEREVLRRLDMLDEINHVRRSREPGQLFVYTDEAAKTMPLLVTTLNNGSGINVKAIDQYEPPFDDVFVHLMQEDSNG